MSSKYHHLSVQNIIQETPDTISIHFQHPAHQKISYKPGQFLTLLVPIGGETHRRSYSMSSCPLTEQEIVVTVKRVAGGKVSNYLADRLQKGASLEVMEPMGNFTIEPDTSKRRHVVLMGAGSGITPLISMAKAVLHLEKGSQVSLIYGNRNQQSIIFKQELEKLQEKYSGRFHVVHILSQPEGGWNGYAGRLNQSMTLKILEKLPKTAPAQTEYYLCGPEGMMEEIKHALQILHVPADKIHKESFVTATDKHGKVEVDEGGGTTVKTQEVTVIYEGSEYKFTVPPSKTILEAALDLDIDLPFSCQSGLCTACRGKCLSGKVVLDEEDGLSEAELKEGYVLTCVGHPLTAGVTIEIG
jgi:ring-1,2-phenylacetyl-CoA epoxidase subunit PaaE